jgi:hypothetical protein
MPSPLSLVQKFDAVTGPFAYCRLLGDRAELDAPTLDQTMIDRTDQIRADAQAIRQLPVLAFVNNHFAGDASDTVEQLLRELQGRDGAGNPQAGQSPWSARACSNRVRSAPYALALPLGPTGGVPLEDGGAKIGKVGSVQPIFRAGNAWRRRCEPRPPASRGPEPAGSPARFCLPRRRSAVSL